MNFICSLSRFRLPKIINGYSYWKLLHPANHKIEHKSSSLITIYNVTLCASFEVQKSKCISIVLATCIVYTLFYRGNVEQNATKKWQMFGALCFFSAHLPSEILHKTVSIQIIIIFLCLLIAISDYIHILD